MGTCRSMSLATRDLQRGQVISLRTRGRPCRVVCTGGRVWVTASNLEADTLLSSGQDAVYGGHRRIVVEALADSTVRLEPQASARQLRPVLAPQAAH